MLKAVGDYDSRIFRMVLKILLRNIVWLFLRWSSKAASLWM